MMQTRTLRRLEHGYRLTFNHQHQMRRGRLEAWRKRHYKGRPISSNPFHSLIDVTQTLCPHAQHGQQSLLSITLVQGTEPSSSWAASSLNQSHLLTYLFES